MMKTRPTIRGAILCVGRRPWPWIIRYVGGLVPAFLVALMLLVPMRPWLSQPLFADALETRSLDLLFDALMGLPEGMEGGPLLLIGLLSLPLLWIGARVLWLFLEGGVLSTYARSKRPSVREFMHACIHWLPTFFLLSILTALATGVVVGVAAAGVVLIQMLSLWSWLSWVVVVAAGMAIIVMWVAAELARASAVVGEDRNVWRALGAAARVVERRFWPLVALVVSTLLIRVLLFLVQRVVSRWVPLSWWWLALPVQQLLQIAVTGLGLVRRAGEIALAFPSQAVEPSTLVVTAQKVADV